jgi:hypothetical protein
MATIPNARLLVASSPYAKKGALWDAFRRYYRQPGPVLVWRAPTRTMNSNVPQEFVDAALAEDPAKNRAEYLAEFRNDLETFLAREVIEAAIPPGVRERAPIPGIAYSAFVDPSGGGADSFTLAVAHKEGERVILDAVYERRPPFSPEAVVAEYCEILRRYKVPSVRGDRYAGQWPQEQFKKRGISYDVADKVTSDIYRDLLPALNSGTVELLDDQTLVSQLVGLERRVSVAGRDRITHPDHAHDDVANAACGALVYATAGSYRQLLEYLTSDTPTRRLPYLGGWYAPGAFGPVIRY